MRYALADKARRPGSPVAHDLHVGTKETLCGEDATLMHRFAYSWPNTDRQTFRRCTRCALVAPTEDNDPAAFIDGWAEDSTHRYDFR